MSTGLKLVDTRHGPPAGGTLVVPASLSLAVAKTMQTTMISLGNKIYNNSAVAADYSSAATAAQAFFANSDEVGFTANIQAWILANSSLFTTTPTTAQLEAAYTTLQSIGSTVTYSEYSNSLLAVPLAARQQFLTTVQTEGLSYFHAQLVAALQSLAASTANVTGQRLIQVNGPACSANTTFKLGAGSVYLAIVAAVVTGPVGWAIFAVGVVLGGAALFCS